VASVSFGQTTAYAGDPGEANTAVDHVVTEDDSAQSSDLENVSQAESQPYEEEFLDQSADNGQLIDASQVVTQSAPEVGTVVGTADSLGSLVSLTRESVSKYNSDDELLYEDADYAIKTRANLDDDWADFPIGPGSYAINFKPNDACLVMYGSEDSDNKMTVCDTVGFQDGTSTGNGRRPYGEADDDGSKYADWWTYHSYGSVIPSDDGWDWDIDQARMVSYITLASASDGNTGLTDYAPNQGSCDGGLSLGGWEFNFGGTLCLGDGQEIVLPDGAGSFGQKKTGIFVTYNSIGFNYRIGVKIKQGVKANWYTISSAHFEKRNPINSQEDSVSDVTYS
jgi:hypothetical protein